MYRKSWARASGFTLIELLVVIGIIAVLISILMPALRRAREQAFAVECLSNLRQVGIMMMNYANENQGIVPEGNHQGRLPNGSYQQDFWTTFYSSAEYAPLQSTGVLHCPYTQSGTYGVPWNGYCGNPSYEVPGEFGTTPYGKYNGPDASYTFCGVKLVGLEDPTNFVLAMDSLEGLNTTESPLESYVGGPFFVAWTWQSGGQVFNAWLAHPINTANAVFADGHAETCDEGRLRSVSNFNLNTANTMGITAYWDTNGVFIY